MRTLRLQLLFKFLEKNLTCLGRSHYKKEESITFCFPLLPQKRIPLETNVCHFLLLSLSPLAFSFSFYGCLRLSNILSWISCWIRWPRQAFFWVRGWCHLWAWRRGWLIGVGRMGIGWGHSRGCVPSASGCRTGTLERHRWDICLWLPGSSGTPWPGDYQLHKAPTGSWMEGCPPGSMPPIRKPCAVLGLKLSWFRWWAIGMGRFGTLRFRR